MKYTIERYLRYPLVGSSYREFSNIFINYSLIDKVWPRDIDTSFRICRNIGRSSCEAYYNLGFRILKLIKK